MVLLIGLGVMLTGFGVLDMIRLGGKPVDVLELDSDEMKANIHVAGDVEFVWDCAISETTEQKTYGVTTSSRESSRYYTFVDMQDEGDYYTFDKVYVIKVSSQYFDLFEKMRTESDNWWNDYTGKVDYPSTSFSYDGYLKKMSDEEREIIMDGLRSMGFTKDEDHKSIDDWVDVYYIQHVANPGASKIMALVGVVFLAAGITVLVLSIKSKKENEQMTAGMAAFGNDAVIREPDLNFDFDNRTQGETFGENGFYPGTSGQDGSGNNDENV